MRISSAVFIPRKCAAYPETGVRHAPFSVCALLRFHCAAWAVLCNKLQELGEQQKQDIITYYKDCPSFSEYGKEVVWVKTTPKAKNSKAYPTYLIYATASDIDLRVEGLYDKYRQETLQPSQKRYQQTSAFIEKVFGFKNQLAINDMVLPFTNVFGLEGSPNQRLDKVRYPCEILRSLRVTVDPTNTNGFLASGGWQFQQNGSYDRNDIKRPFTSITPYVIAPNQPEVKGLIEILFRCLDKDSYNKKDKSKTYYEDYEFLGLNTDTAREKYNVEFLKPSDKDILFVSPTEQEYQTVALRIKREYTSQEKTDYNRIVLIVLPETANPEEDHPLYHKLKKIFVEDGVPTQFMTIQKLRGLTDPKVPYGTILWNLFLDLYVKLGGKPWRLANPVSNVNCFIGVGFAVNPRVSNNHIYAGVANVFDRYGNWLDVTSDYQKIDEEQRGDFFDSTTLLEGTNSFKISKAVTKKIVSDSLELYRLTQTKQQLYPRNIVFHKLGEIYQCEIDGILESIAESIGTFQECRIGIASIHSSHNLRLYGSPYVVDNKPLNSSRVVLRGTKIGLLPNKELLATTGKIQRKEKVYYHGIGTPRPLVIEGIIPNKITLGKFNVSPNQFYTTSQMSSHIYALTQLHWGSLREDIRYPITVLYAKKVADIISKSDILRLNPISINIKRPWFI